MKNRLKTLTWSAVLVVALGLLVGCQPAPASVITETPPKASTSQAAAATQTSPPLRNTPVLLGTAVPQGGAREPSPYRSEYAHLEVTLPVGWAPAGGPLELARPFTGWVAFNSWGEAGYWATETSLGSSRAYSPESVLEQMPAEGVYVVLVEQSGGPARVGYGPEYAAQDLNDLLQEDACQPGSANSYDFYKWSRLFRLEIYCGSQAGANQQAELVQLLESWRFDPFIPGDPGWAMSAAVQLLPEQVEPELFIAPVHETIEYSRTQAEVQRFTTVLPGNEGDGTLYISFVYVWAKPALSRDLSPFPSESTYTWDIQAGADGEISLISQRGKLPDPNGPAPTPYPTAAPLSYGRIPPPVLYVNQGRLYEQKLGAAPKELADLQDEGFSETEEFKAHVLAGKNLFLLNAEALVRVNLENNSTQVIQRFDSPVLFGDLQTTHSGNLVFYSATSSSSSSESGFTGFVGVYNADSQSNRILHTEAYPVRILGPSADQRSLYVLQVGGDPSFGGFFAISLVNGEIVSEVSATGDLFSALSPRARYFATQGYRTEQAGQGIVPLLALYDLAAKQITPRKMELPAEDAHIAAMHWSPDMAWLYVLLASDPLYDLSPKTNSLGFWQVSPVTGEFKQIAGGLPGGVSRLTTNQNWALLRHPDTPMARLVDLATGSSRPVTLPWEAVPGPSLNELPVQLSDNGEWLLVWHVPQGQASLVNLGRGQVGSILIPPDSVLIGWR